MAPAVRLTFAVLLGLGCGLDIAGRRTPSGLRASEINATAVSISAPLSEEGYLSVAVLQDDDAMETYIRRVVAANAYVVGFEGGLSGFVPWYSGGNATQTLARMTRELFGPPVAWWIAEGPGRTVPLDDDGFQEVSALNDQAQMRALLFRMVESMELLSIDEAAMDELAGWLSNEKILGRFQEVSQILKLPQYTTPSNMSLNVTSEEEATGVVKDIVRELLETEGAAVLDERGLGGFAFNYFKRRARGLDLRGLRRELHDPKQAWWVLPFAPHNKTQDSYRNAMAEVVGK